jgi:hypothetical protein
MSSTHSDFESTEPTSSVFVSALDGESQSPGYTMTEEQAQRFLADIGHPSVAQKSPRKSVPKKSPLTPKKDKVAMKCPRTPKKMSRPAIKGLPSKQPNSKRSVVKPVKDEELVVAAKKKVKASEIVVAESVPTLISIPKSKKREIVKSISEDISSRLDKMINEYSQNMRKSKK